MAIRIQRPANVSKQATLLNGLDVSPLKWRVCGCGLKRFVHGAQGVVSTSRDCWDGSLLEKICICIKFQDRKHEGKDQELILLYFFDNCKDGTS